MKAIQANPKTIRQVFTDEYVIPKYQRRYAWEEDKCDQLWEDLTNFWSRWENGDEKEEEENYFLGTITLYKGKEKEGKVDSFFSVVDGQQRLISLALLIKALYGFAGTYDSLKSCLVKKDPRTDKYRDGEPRIKSEVLNEDNEEIKRILLPSKDGDDTSGNDPSLFEVNYQLFVEKIGKWRREVEEDPDKLMSFIDALLDKVTILPIECGSEDDALTIFETLNDRGLSLNDTDIFKVKIHNSVPNQQAAREEFFQAWSELKNHLRLFRIYMHISRAEREDTSKEIGLRRYFKEKHDISKSDSYKEVMPVLKKLDHINRDSWTIPNSILKWWKILEKYPNDYWEYPLYVFLHKHTSEGKEWNEDGNLLIDETGEVAKKLLELIEWTVRYFYIKGVNHNTVNSVKDTTFAVCKSIYHGGDYLKVYEENLSKGKEFPEFEKNISERPLKRYLRGVILIGAAKNLEQDEKDFCNFLARKFDIEHILPKKWSNYDKWDKDSHKDNIQKLGNLVPCEKSVNISASNEFFQRKQEKYKKSKVQDVLDLSESPSKWLPENLADRHEEIVGRILNFFLQQK